VVNEAALAGLPIVMTDPGVSEVMADGVTGLYAKATSRDFAAALTKLLANDSLRLQLGQAASQRAASYSAAHQTEKLLGLYGQAIKHHRAKPPKPPRLPQIRRSPSR
jgi:D-inositol-3-phosphate glycosyltransferase